jgi:hypothetical protein
MPSFVDGIDSHYNWVKSRIAVKNPDRSVKGLLQAQDWPSQKIELSAFYLLVVGTTPLDIQAGSIAGPHVSHLLQWVWIVKGTDLAANQRMRNRGDRFRTHMAMKDELVYAMYPNYTEKKTWSYINEVWTGESLVPAQHVSWSRVQFQERLDKDSGVIYGTASVHVSDMLTQIDS